MLQEQSLTSLRDRLKRMEHDHYIASCSDSYYYTSSGGIEMSRKIAAIQRKIAAIADQAAADAARAENKARL